MKIDHIVFDIGQVLLHWDPHHIYQDLIPDETDRTHFLTHVCSPEWNIEQDRGRDWVEGENLLIQQHPDKKHLIRAFKKDWIKSIPHAIQGSVDIMQKFIEEGRDVTMLTNFNQHTFAEAQEKYPFLTTPRGVTVSGDVKLVKPEPEIYHLHTATFGLSPEKCLFIDDSLPNVFAARDAGWSAVHFSDDTKLASDLAELQLL